VTGILPSMRTRFLSKHSLATLAKAFKPAGTWDKDLPLNCTLLISTNACHLLARAKITGDVTHVSKPRYQIIRYARARPRATHAVNERCEFTLVAQDGLHTMPQGSCDTAVAVMYSLLAISRPWTGSEFDASSRPGSVPIPAALQNLELRAECINLLGEAVRILHVLFKPLVRWVRVWYNVSYTCMNQDSQQSICNTTHRFQC
jgi:hypothetical protein